MKIKNYILLLIWSLILSQFFILSHNNFVFASEWWETNIKKCLNLREKIFNNYLNIKQKICNNKDYSYDQANIKNNFSKYKEIWCNIDRFNINSEDVKNYLNNNILNKNCSQITWYIKLFKQTIDITSNYFNIKTYKCYDIIYNQNNKDKINKNTIKLKQNVKELKKYICKNYAKDNYEKLNDCEKDTFDNIIKNIKDKNIKEIISNLNNDWNNYFNYISDVNKEICEDFLWIKQEKDKQEKENSQKKCISIREEKEIPENPENIVKSDPAYQEIEKFKNYIIWFIETTKNNLSKISNNTWNNNLKNLQLIDDDIKKMKKIDNIILLQNLEKNTAMNEICNTWFKKELKEDIKKTFSGNYAKYYNQAKIDILWSYDSLCLQYESLKNRDFADLKNKDNIFKYKKNIINCIQKWTSENINPSNLNLQTKQETPKILTISCDEFKTKDEKEQRLYYRYPEIYDCISCSPNYDTDWICCGNGNHIAYIEWKNNLVCCPKWKYLAEKQICCLAWITDGKPRECIRNDYWTFWISCWPEELLNWSCAIRTYQMLWIRNTSNQNTDVWTFVQDLILAATSFIWVVATISLIYSWFIIIMSGSWNQIWDLWKAKTWIIYSIIWMWIAAFSYAIIRLIQYIAQW